MKLNSVLRPARKILVTALVTGVTAAGVTAVAPTTATAAPSPSTGAVSLVAVRSASPAYSDVYYEKGVQYWVNVQRKRHGLRALRLASCTDYVAENWSAYLASSNSFYHQSMTSLLNRCAARYAGETLGRGSILPKTLVTMWMHSTAHRRVLMSRQPTRIGIGATPNANGEWVTTANFMRF
jgi:uncharacterized protein YkwD